MGGTCNEILGKFQPGCSSVVCISFAFFTLLWTDFIVLFSHLWLGWRQLLVKCEGLLYFFLKSARTHTRSLISRKPALPSTRCIQTRYLFLRRIVSEAERLHGDWSPQLRMGERRRQRRERWFQLMCHCRTLVDTLCWCALTQAVSWYAGLPSPCSCASPSFPPSLPFCFSLSVSLSGSQLMFLQHSDVTTCVLFDYNSSIQRSLTTDSNTSVKAHLKVQRERKTKLWNQDDNKALPQRVGSVSLLYSNKDEIFQKLPGFKGVIITCTANLRTLQHSDIVSLSPVSLSSQLQTRKVH